MRPPKFQSRPVTVWHEFNDRLTRVLRKKFTVLSIHTTVWHEFDDRLVQSTLPLFRAMTLTSNDTMTHYNWNLGWASGWSTVQFEFPLCAGEVRRPTAMPSFFFYVDRVETHPNSHRLTSTSVFLVAGSWCEYGEVDFMGLDVGSICIIAEVDGAADVHEPDGSEMDLCLY
jgi:hypothetical protein